MNKHRIRESVYAVMIAGFLLSVPTHVEANTVLRVGPDAEVAEGQSVAGDLYLSAGLYERTVMQGDVDGDAVVAGLDTAVAGSVAGDIFVIGATTEITASTSDDVRIAAIDATIDAAIDGDVFVVGGSVTIAQGTVIAGDVLVFAGDVTIEGEIQGSLFGVAERARVDGVIGGNIDIKAAAGLTLGDEAVIAGDVSYEGRADLVRSQNSVIEGSVTERAYGADDATHPRAVVTPLFILLFSALSLFLLFKKQLQEMQDHLLGHPLINGGIGAAVLFAAPVVAFVFLATVLAAPLGLLLLSILAILSLTALVLSGVTLGHYVFSTFFGATSITLVSIIVGTTLLYAALFVPVVGVLIYIVTFMVTIGAIARYVAAKLA